MHADKLMKAVKLQWYRMLMVVCTETFEAQIERLEFPPAVTSTSLYSYTSSTENKRTHKRGFPKPQTVWDRAVNTFTPLLNTSASVSAALRQDTA